MLKTPTRRKEAMKRRAYSTERKLSSGKVLKKYAAGPRGQQSYAKRLLAGLKKRSGPELKCFDTFFTTGNITGHTVTPVHNIAQGPDFDERIGNHIRAKSLHLKILLGSDAVDTGHGLISRILVVCDKQQIGDTDPTEATVLASATYPLTSPVHPNVLDRFVVLADELVKRENVLPQSDGNTAISDTHNTSYFERYIRLDHDIGYNGAASTDIQSGGIYVMILVAPNLATSLWTEEAAAAVRAQAWYRLRYTDQ